MPKLCLECEIQIDGKKKYCSNTCVQKACRRRKAESNLCRRCSKPLESGSYCERCLDIQRDENKKCFSKNYRDRPRYSNLIAKMITSAKIRAKKKNIEFSITENDIVIPSVCPVLGFEIHQNIGKVRNNSPTLDRIDNTKGYIPGNVAVISYRANCLKRDASLDELIKLVNYVKSYQ